jgi:hypothetical protein
MEKYKVITVNKIKQRIYKVAQQNENIIFNSAVLSQPVYRTATYRCDDTRGSIKQF